MTARSRWLLVLVVTCACAPPGAQPGADAGSEGTIVPRATCDAPIGGPASWPLTSSEGTPGYDEELAALDLDALPATIDLAGDSELVRSLVAYALEIDQAELGTTLDKELALAHGELGRAVLGAVAIEDASGAAGLDTTFLRRGLHRFYACDRGFPLTLAGFRASVLDHRALPFGDVTDSRPKGGLRRIYEASDDGVYVAETIDDDGGVRETEVLLEGRRADGALDFAVYDRDGNLADRSQFSTTPGNTIIGASPYTCMTCHRDSWRYEVLVPALP